MAAEETLWPQRNNRFPAGMTERKTKAKTKVKAKAKAKAKAKTKAGSSLRSE
ncbi:MAG: hypothetical protein M3R43_12900 [Acidobacteriota bacterium]|nr:hypothetical protein [Acidobacteriota bacterium]